MPSINSNARVVVIGGGATGCGIARDLILRQFDVTLVESGDLGCGTSGRFHGMLQSGARYAVSDTEYAAQCMRERLIVANLVPDAVEKTGGLFISLADDPPDFADKFVMGCQNAHIPVEELDPGWVMAEEPAISRNVLRAFSVPDATVQSWRLVNLLADDVRRRGGTILTRHQVKGIEVSNGRAHRVRVVGSSSEQVLDTDIVINATGPWSARVADMVGESVNLELVKGSIIVFAHRMIQRVVNRCRPPTSHDIMVPTGTVSLFGTTSKVVDDPDVTHVHPQEIQELLDNAETIIPRVRSYRVLRSWAGVRPLYCPQNYSPDTPLSRHHTIIDHSKNGLAGFFTICGGSLTTHRFMAEDLGDYVCQSLGLIAPSTTTTTLLTTDTKNSNWQPTNNFFRIEKEQRFLTPVCECESVEQSEVIDLIKNHDICHLHDLRRRLRIGFGPCQGTFCGSRVAALIANCHPNYPVSDDLRRFWVERLKGGIHVAWGSQAKQALLSDTVYRETLGIRLSKEIISPDNR